MKAGNTQTKKGTFGKPDWFDKVKYEYWACRVGVGLIDMSTFTKFEISVSFGVFVIDLEYRNEESHNIIRP